MEGTLTVKITKAQLRRLIKEELQTVMEAPHTRTDTGVSRADLARTVDGRGGAQARDIGIEMGLRAGVMSRLKSKRRSYLNIKSPIPYEVAAEAIVAMVGENQFHAEAFEANLEEPYSSMYTDERNKFAARAPWYDRLELWVEKVSGGASNDINFS